jgi:hypothetical protein
MGEHSRGGRRPASSAQEGVSGGVGGGLAWYFLKGLALRSFLPDAIAQRGTLPAP